MIVDANVIVSAVLGRSFPLLIQVAERGHELLVPVHQIIEASSVAIAKGKRPRAEIDAAFQAITTVVEEIEPDTYLPFEYEARLRLDTRGQPDWPVLAAAMMLDDAIWSNDRDFFGVGVPVWSSANIGRATAA